MELNTEKKEGRILRLNFGELGRNRLCRDTIFSQHTRPDCGRSPLLCFENPAVPVSALFEREPPGEVHGDLNGVMI